MRKRHESYNAVTEYLVDDIEKYNNKRRRNNYNVHPAFALLLLVYLIGLYGIAYLIDETLPVPLQISDEKHNPERFITERARNDTKELFDIGPHTVGSYENEVLALDFFKRKIAEIQSRAHTNQNIELDIQSISGSYHLDFKPYGAMSAYSKIQNVIVKLHSRNRSNHSLLINTHFDTVPGSSGASDAAIMCAISLEILRKLSRLPNALEHNIIFLFNGAKETPLQGSHGFIQYHKWAKEVEAIVNLDAGGAGGKESLIQVGLGQSWLLKYYHRVPYPHSQVAGEEVFQSGIIPSDTDFRVFRDTGKMIGLELVFYKDGFRYHTSYDLFKNIPAGSYQHAGDNMLSLIKNLANAPELSDPHGQPKENLIFYDFLELMFVSYTERTAIKINIFITVMSVIIALKSFQDLGLRFSLSLITYVCLTFGAILLSWNLSGFIAFAIAILLDILKSSMRWYNNIWMLCGLYVAPIICCCAGVLTVLNKFYEKSHLTKNVQAQVQAHVVRIIWTLTLAMGTSHGIRSVYSITVMLFFQTITAIVIQAFSMQHSTRSWKITYVFGTTVPVLFLLKQTSHIIAALIPVTGRMGSQHNVEVYVAALSVLITIFIFSSYIPLITLIHNPRVILRTLVGIFIVCFLIALTPLTFPYTNNPESPRPQRFLIYHTSRVFRDDINNVYKNDSGYFVFNLDRNSPDSIKKYVKGLSRTKPFIDDCPRSLLCGVSVMNPRLIGLIPYSTMIPSEQPMIKDPISLTLNSKTKVTSVITRFDFTASGPSQMTFYVSARPSTRLLKTNLVPYLPSNPIIWNGRPLYIIIHSWGKEKTPLDLTLDFETPTNWNNKPVFDITMFGNYKNNKTNVKTPQFVQFLREFPEWTDSQVWLSMHEAWVY